MISQNVCFFEVWKALSLCPVCKGTTEQVTPDSILQLNVKIQQAQGFIENIPLHTENPHLLHYVEMAQKWLKEN